MILYLWRGIKSRDVTKTARVVFRFKCNELGGTLLFAHTHTHTHTHTHRITPAVMHNGDWARMSGLGADLSRSSNVSSYSSWSLLCLVLVAGLSCLVLVLSWSLLCHVLVAVLSCLGRSCVLSCVLSWSLCVLSCVLSSSLFFLVLVAVVSCLGLVLVAGVSCLGRCFVLVAVVSCLVLVAVVSCLDCCCVLS